MTSKIKILFVDDEPHLLQSLKRMLHSARHEWDCQFASGAQEALDMMARQPVDLIVSDMRMPGMDGATLLTRVRKEHPKTIRFILSGQAEDNSFLRAMGSMHQFLSKPCSYETLKDAVNRAFSLRYRLNDPNWEKLLLEIKTIPSLPEVYYQLMEVVQSSDSSLEDIAAIISQDAGMAAKILQVANSAFFGFSHQIYSIEQAVSILGMDMIHALVLSHEIFSRLSDSKGGLVIKHLWEHNLIVTGVALALAEYEKKGKEFVNYTFTSGLLHDIGQCLLAGALPEKFRKMKDIEEASRISQWEVETRVFGADHQQIGAYLLNLWGLPDPIVEAVAFHHNPSASLQTWISPLTMIHVANVLDRERGERDTGIRAPALDENYLKRVGVFDRFPAWRKVGLQKMEGQ